jgi:hypothetical protein
MASRPSLVLEGIRRIDLMELTEELPEGTVVPIPVADTRDGSMHGQPVSDLAVVVALSLPTIQALAVWLAKHRVRTTGKRELTIVRKPDGTMVLTVREGYTTTGSEPPDQSLVEAIGSQLRTLLPDNPAEH